MVFQSAFNETFRSLRHRNFRLYATGQVISLAGTWMQQVALSWLVYRLTKSPALLGVVSFANLSPVLFLGMVGGMAADRFDRRKLLIATQALAMMQAVLLAYLTLSGQLQIWQIIALAASLGIINAFDMPARQSLVANLVGKEDIVNAVGLNSSLFHASRIIGPAIAGFLVTYFSEGICFAINAASFLGTLVALTLIGKDYHHNKPVAHGKSAGLKDALIYVSQNKTVRNTILLLIVVNLLAVYLVLLPVFVGEVLHMQAAAFGWLTACAGFGSCVAALAVARKGSRDSLKAVLGWATFGLSIALIVFSQSRSLPLSMIAATAAGFFTTVQLSGGTALIQLTVPDALRGRLIALGVSLGIGFVPVGSLLAGWAAHKFGAPVTVLVAGLLLMWASAIYFWLSKERPGLAAQSFSPDANSSSLSLPSSAHAGADHLAVTVGASERTSAIVAECDKNEISKSELAPSVVVNRCGKSERSNS